MVGTDFRFPVSVQQLKRHAVKVLVRVCEPTYDTERLHKEGITVKVTIIVARDASVLLPV